MIDNVTRLPIHKEIHSKEFTLQIYFQPKGGIKGIFIRNTTARPITYELSNGLFLQNGIDINFSFSVDWLQNHHVSVASCFSGNYLLKEESYILSWLTTYQSTDGSYKHSKVGALSSISEQNNTIARPFPSTYFERFIITTPIWTTT